MPEGMGSGSAPRLGTALHPQDCGHCLGNAELCPSSPVLGERDSLLRAVRGKTAGFSLSSEKGKLKTH